ncbi:MAG: hypothetical protein QOF48_3728 [Verrucomicrobiota bacterium]|jgi:hypothetical protein
MILLVAGAQRYADPRIGDFVTPHRWGLVGTTPVWAADNGAFSDFDASRFTKMLDAIAAAPIRPRFVTVPDVVCNHRATVELWLHWARALCERNLPRAFVIQNGIEDLPPRHALPWRNLDAIFIGGDTRFKFSPWVKACAWWARRLGKWVHMGRVNSVRRLDYARSIGCHSCDGSGMARFRTNVLEPMRTSLNREQLFLL